MKRFVLAAQKGGSASSFANAEALRLATGYLVAAAFLTLPRTKRFPLKVRINRSASRGGIFLILTGSGLRRGSASF